jgi:hypothetical protein
MSDYALRDHEVELFKQKQQRKWCPTAGDMCMGPSCISWFESTTYNETYISCMKENFDSIGWAPTGRRLESWHVQNWNPRYRS